MVLYVCFRCGYKTTQRGSIKHHLNRKNKCQPILENISIEEVKKYYNLNLQIKINPNPNNESKMNPDNEFKMNPKQKHKCNYCNKYYSTNSNLHKHFRNCKIKLKYEQELKLEQKKDEIIEIIDENKEIVNENKESINDLKIKINKLENIIEDLSYDLKECQV